MKIGLKINRTAGVIAIVGVLLHAFALVHHTLMLADALPHAAGGLRVAAAFPYDFPLCRGSGASRADGISGQPAEPDPVAPHHRPLPCPVCSGSSAAYALASSPVALAIAAGDGVLDFAPPHERAREAEAASLPPARAPPASA